MNALMLHNFYQQPGGEDQSFLAEVDLLRRKGHFVDTFTTHNDGIKAMNPLAVAAKTLWNRDTCRQLDALFQRTCYDIAHFQNTFPLISPAAYYVAKAYGVAVVQSLRNYRLMCVNALFFRDGRVCEDCLGKTVAWPGVLHGCYRNSRAASAVVATMNAFHHLRGTWAHMVDVYIALTEFSKQKFIEAGLPANKIVVKPNFLVQDPGVGAGTGNYALFVGRLTPEKGIMTLLKAWKAIGKRLPLKIVGDGPLKNEVLKASEQQEGVDWLGLQHPNQVLHLMGEACFVIFPSEWYETFGRVAIEAFAKGTPVVAANIGAIAEIVHHGKTGLLFRPSDASDFAAQVEWLLSHPNEQKQMRQAARAEFEAKYTAAANYEMLQHIYQLAIDRAR
ncbi:MAG: glycosyltransferase family 4 protein [Desulfurococcaceae archaeon]